MLRKGNKWGEKMKGRDRKKSEVREYGEKRERAGREVKGKRKGKEKDRRGKVGNAREGKGR